MMCVLALCKLTSIGTYVIGLVPLLTLCFDTSSLRMLLKETEAIYCCFSLVAEGSGSTGS